MLWVIAVILLDLWYLSVETSYTFGGRTHLLLPLAIVVILVQVIQRLRTAPAAQKHTESPALDRGRPSETLSGRPKVRQ